MILAEIITIGDEILIGQITDTNSPWLAQQLNALGIEVAQMTSVHDDAEHIVEALERARNNVDLVLITGGLGPTKDDITKKTLASYCNTQLIIDENRLKELETYFVERGRTMNELNRLQALHPEGAFLIPNEIGTAAGIWIRKGNLHIISMPGVPYEMKKMMEDTVLPKIKTSFDLPYILHRTIHTIGVPESNLALKIETWEDQLPAFIKLAYLPNLGKVRLRLSGKHQDRNMLEEGIKKAADQLYELIPEHIFGEENDTIEETIGKLLMEEKATLATAESCTGGFIAHQLTKVPGSSRYFEGSVISYSNTIKKGFLDVQESVLHKHGAVSEPVVIQMAEAVRKKMGTTYALSCSGIAGPGGGTQEKPVGTVWIACASEKGTIAKQYQFPKGRLQNIQLTATFALEMLRQRILE